MRAKPVQDLLPIAESARCIIGNDTGTAHLVAATGTPMLIIFGPTDPRRAKPVGKHVIALQVDNTVCPASIVIAVWTARTRTA